METGRIIVGLIFTALGGFEAIRPDLFLRFQIWVNRVVMGADFRPSHRTETIVRSIGAFIMVIGLAVLAGFSR